MRAFLIAAAMAAGVAATAFAATEKPATGAPEHSACFSSMQWKGWKAKDEHTMYIRVGLRDVYEVGFKQGCRQAQYPDAHLVTVFRGSNYVCRPIDLDIAVSDSGPGAISVPCIATSLRKLPAAEAAAIPKKYQP